MALSNITIEVRPSGSDTNGGGFGFGAAGADFSQQNSPNATQQGSGTTLAAAITSTTATTCSLTAIANLYGAQQALLANPLVGDWLKIDNEIVKVTAVSAGVPTIARGQLGTTAATHLIGATVTNISNVSTTDLVTAGTTTIMSATAYFSANSIGNVIYIAGGSATITAGWYQIASVSTSGSNTTAVLDRSTGLATGSGATVNIGGALASPGIAVSIMPNYSLTWVRGSSYSFSTATMNVSGGCLSTNSTGGSGAQYTAMVGYSSMRGDGGQVTFTLGSGVSSATMFNNSACTVQNIIFNGNSQTSSVGMTCPNLGGGTIKNCLFKNFTSYGMQWGATEGQIINCGATGCSGTAAFSMASGFFTGCVAWNNTCTGFASTAGYLSFCLSYNNTGSVNVHGFSATSSFAMNCAAYGNAGNGFYEVICLSCHAENNGQYGYRMRVQSDTLNNCFAYNNTSGAVLATVAAAALFQTVTSLGSTAFISASTGNFALNNNTTGGAMLRAAGFPGTFQNGTTTSYLDAGPSQSRVPWQLQNMDGGMNG